MTDITSAGVPARGQRRDAARNDALVLSAAREILAESGPQACIEDIAARAGVGIGTIYRRFASKDALIDALVQVSTEELYQAAAAAVEHDDGHGLESFLRALGQFFFEHRRYAGLMLARGEDESTTKRIRARIDKLTRNAVAAGTLGEGVTLGDVMSLIWALRALIETSGDVAPTAWRRYLDIHLAGLRTPGALSAAPMTARQIERISAAG